MTQNTKTKNPSQQELFECEVENIQHQLEQIISSEHPLAVLAVLSASSLILARHLKNISKNHRIENFITQNFNELELLFSNFIIFCQDHYHSEKTSDKHTVFLGSTFEKDIQVEMTIYDKSNNGDTDA